MSASVFNFRIDTSRDFLSEKLDAVKAHAGAIKQDGKIIEPEAEQSLIESVKQIAKNFVVGMDKSFDGAMVLGNGMQDSANGRATCTFQIYGKTGHV